MLVDGCSSCAPHLAACSLLGITQCAGIHWRTTLHVLQSSCICVARRGDLFIWRVSNTDNASVRKTVGEHGSKESLTKIAACLYFCSIVGAVLPCGRTGRLCCTTGILDDDTSAAVCNCLGC